MLHSILSPSGAHRWLACAASAGRCANVIEETSPFAEEGTLAHSFGELGLREDRLVNSSDKVEGVVIPTDMVDPVNTYISTVQTMTEGCLHRGIEEEIDLSTVLGVLGEKGTGDCVALMPDMELQVHDLKYGKGVAVAAEDNEQLKLYALGAMDQIEMLFGEVSRIRLVIHQPRLNTCDEWVIGRKELIEFGALARLRAIEAIKLHNHPEKIGLEHYTPGIKQCKWCKVKGKCSSYDDYIQDAIGVHFQDESAKTEIKKSMVEQTDNEELGRIVPLLPLILDWAIVKGNMALNKMLSGETIPGQKLVMGKGGRRKWIDEKVTEDTLKRFKLKEKERYSRKVISPAVAQKLLEKDSKRQWAKLQKEITSKPPSPIMVSEEDKRDSVDMMPIEDHFQDDTVNAKLIKEKESVLEKAIEPMDDLEIADLL